MTMTDPIADMLTRMRNANRVFKNSVNVPMSKLKLAIAKILKQEGYIRDYKLLKDGEKTYLRIYLKYTPDRKRAINGLKRISKPGLRVYAPKDKLPRVLGGMGIAIISTSKGVLTDKDSRKLNVGGEVLCYVW